MEQGGDEPARPRVKRRAAVTDEDLITVVVAYPHGVDRCTVYPTGLTETERLTCWLSADEAAFESLETRR